MTSDETLRVVPVDERPEFVPQGKVDDSQTRIFGRLADEAAQEAQQSEQAPAEPAKADVPAAGEAEQQGDTIRFDRAAIDEVKRREEEAGKAAKGKKRSDIKPMKKKKKGFGFGKKKEDDLIEADEDFADGEDDFFE